MAKMSAFSILVFAGVLFLVLILALGLTGNANAEERAFHRICEGKGSAACIPSDQFIQRRDACSGENEGLCYGIGRTSDGWVTDLVRKGRCYWTKGLANGVPCDPMPFRYGVIEYKTNGLKTAHRWQSKQVTEITQEIAAEKDVFLVVFIHGWHHDSREEVGKEYSEEDLRTLKESNITQDRNLLFFKHILAKTRWELDRNGLTTPKVLGVYIGWDGGPPNAKNNVGNRAIAADKIGLSSDFDTDLKALRQALKKAGPNNKMLVIGHSLGGRIVSRFMLKNADEGNLNPLGTGSLAVTMNPAISADSFDAYVKRPSAPGLPAWINITSRDDWATRLLYPLASTPLSRLLGIGRGLNDTLTSRATGTSIGHYEPYQNFQLSICYEGSANSCTSNMLIAGCKAPPHQTKRLPTNWFRLGAGDDSSCQYMCYSFGSADSSCSSSQYLVTLMRHNDEKQQLREPSGTMWNVYTDVDVIGPNEDYRNQSAEVHNAFDQTNLGRMLVELTLAR